MRTAFLLAALSALSLGAAPSVLPNGAVMTPNGEVGRAQPVATDVSGLYAKPDAGIPASDLSSGVRTSLGRADSALQAESDPHVSYAGGVLTVHGEVVPASGPADVARIVDSSFAGGTQAVDAVVSAVGSTSNLWNRAGSDATNYVDAATNAVRRTDGAARPLPKYLHVLDFDDSYPDSAAEYYRSRGDGRADGGCSAVRDGGFVRRNFDYPFDERAEFVVRMGAGAGRFASVGVAQVGTNLTEDVVTSGKPNRWYKALPGATVDGVNENGVVCEINVSDDVPSWHSAGSLHPLGVVRWILDHATNALHGAEYVAANVRFPAGWVQNFHYMVADREKTYLVENGEVYDFDDYHEPDEPAAMTNFPLNRFPWDGMGMERFGLLLRGESITNAWYTRAYRRETTPPWVSEFSADVLARTNEIFNAWASHPREYFRGKTNGGEPWWQTVHTSVYDIQKRTLRISVQESGDWYVFSLSGVYSVNGKSGTVTLGPADVGALPVEDAATIDYVDSATGEVMRVTRDLIKPKLPMSCLTNANGVGFVDLKGANTYTPIVTSWDDSIYSYYDSISEVAFGGGVFLLSGGRGLLGVRWSEDGASWTSVTGVAATASMNAFAYGNGIHLAIESPSSNYGVYRSSDGGRTWRKSTGKSTGKFAAVSFANGEFFLSSNDGGLYRSSDGDSWTTISAMNGKVCSRVVYGNGAYITFTSNGAWRSTDATTWTLSASTGIKRELMFGGGMFLAVGDPPYNGLVRSADGISWYSVSNLAGNSIAYGGGVYVAALYSGMYGYGLIYSNDGTTWQSATGPAEDAMFYKIVYSDGVFVAVGPGIWYSTNGASWTKVSYPTPSAHLAAVGNHRFIVAEKGHGVAYKSRLSVVNGSVKVVQGVTVNGSVLAPDSNNVVNITISESDPTVPAWAKEENPPTESDPTVPAWAKGENPPVESDPTVPAWAKQPNPPQGMDYEAMTNTVNETKSRYFDSGLGVEWTFVPMNGEFMLIATTNVNREVIE